MWVAATWPRRWTFTAVSCLLVFAALLAMGNAEADGLSCAQVLGRSSIARPTRAAAWRAEIAGPTAVFQRPPVNTVAASRWLSPTDVLWLLVVGRPRVADNRCWLPVRLPWRPNDAAGWVNADNVVLDKTPWRIEVSTTRRTLTLFRAGSPVRTVSVVVGKSNTPTPVGLFAIVWAIPWHPNDFLGSWVLELTAHSDVLRQFESGDGTVGIHGRGAASLVDPLGSARSHGCVRLANGAIDQLVETVGDERLLGTPVEIT
jgi:L,D-transpeptidase catalytic domain